MSQYPPGYPSQYPLPYYYPGQPMTVDPLAPARRACITMIIVGIIALLMAGCVGFTAAMLPQLKSMPEFQQSLAQVERQAGGLKVTTLLIAAAVLFGVVAIVQIILGVLVRGGGLVVGVLAIVFTALMLIYSAVNLIVSIITPGQLAGGCVSLGMAGVFIVQLVFLIQVCRNSGAVRAMNQMTAMPQMGWGQPMPGYPMPMSPPGMQYGYGYGPAAPPSPPPANDDPTRAPP